jgi:hypothetical protein
MSHLTATIIGLIGSATFIAAFAYANVSSAMDKRLFNAMNLAGAILLLISLSVDFNLPAVILESAWGVIALIGLIAAIRGNRTSQP